MKNRIIPYQNQIPNIAEDFSSFIPYTLQNAFSSPVILLENYIELFRQKEIEKAIEVKRAREKGYEDAIGRILENITKEINDYMELITRITDFVYEKVTKDFKDIKIIEARTNLYFGTKFIRVLFIVETEYERELELIKLFNEIKSIVLNKKNVISEIFVLNKKDTEIDNFSLEADYPFIRNFQKDKAD